MFTVCLLRKTNVSNIANCTQKPEVLGYVPGSEGERDKGSIWG